MCERKWVFVEGQGLIDVDAFVMFRVAPRKRERLIPAGVGNVGMLDGYDDIWVIEAFPGPSGDFMSVAVFEIEALADAVLGQIVKALTQ